MLKVLHCGSQDQIPGLAHDPPLHKAQLLKSALDIAQFMAKYKADGSPIVLEGCVKLERITNENTDDMYERLCI